MANHWPYCTGQYQAHSGQTSTTYLDANSRFTHKNGAWGGGYTGTLAYALACTSRKEQYFQTHINAITTVVRAYTKAKNGGDRNREKIIRGGLNHLKHLWGDKKLCSTACTGKTLWQVLSRACHAWLKNARDKNTSLWLESAAQKHQAHHHQSTAQWGGCDTHNHVGGYLRSLYALHWKDNLQKKIYSSSNLYTMRRPQLSYHLTTRLKAVCCSSRNKNFRPQRQIS